MDFSNTRYYEILGVTKDASFESIYRAKDRLKFGNPDDRVPISMWSEIDEAYNVLSKPDTRKRYDEYLTRMASLGGDNSALIDEKKKDEEESIVEEVVDDSEVIEENPQPIEEDIVEKDEEEPIVEEVVDDSETIEENPQSTEEDIVEKDFEVSKDQELTQKDIELEEIEAYENALNEEIDNLLLFPNNSYKLEINILKYKRKIELLEKILEMRKSRKIMGKIDAIKNKVEITSIVNQLETAIARYNELKSRVEEYNNNSLETGLSKVNTSIINNIDEMEKLKSKEDKKFSEKVRISKLEFSQKFLLKMRSGLSKTTKFKIYHLGLIKDKVDKTSDKIRSLTAIFKKSEEIDSLYEEVEEMSSKTR